MERLEREGGRGSFQRETQIKLHTCANMWQGGRAINLRSAGFHAERMIRRSSGLCFILLITSKS